MIGGGRCQIASFACVRLRLINHEVPSYHSVCLCFSFACHGGRVGGCWARLAGHRLCLQASPSQVLKPRSTQATSCSDTLVEQISWVAMLPQCGSSAKHQIAQRICCVKDRHANVCFASSCSVSLTNRHRLGPAHKVLPWSSCCSASRGSPERQHYVGRTISFARPNVLFV